MNDNPTQRDAQRDHLMAALSAAEQVVATAPVVPDELQLKGPVTAAPGPYVLDLFFHRCPQDVVTFATSVGATAVTREHTAEDPRPYTEVSGVVFGHRFRAWTLGAVPDAHLRECQLVEQHHQIDDPAEPDPGAYIAALPLDQSPLAVSS